MSIAENIKIIRGKLSQKAFADAIGAKQSLVQVWEAGKSMPGSEYLIRIHDRFDVDLNWLVTGKGNKKIGLTQNHTDAPPSRQQIKIADALAMAARVLESGTSYATALYLNIEHFERAVSAEKKMDELTTAQNQTNADLIEMQSKMTEIERKLEMLQTAETEEALPHHRQSAA